MGTLYRYELKKLLCQKVLWIAVALMTLILVGVGITDVVTGRAAISKNYKEFSGREIDDFLIKEVQEAEDQDHYIVFRSFINFWKQKLKSHLLISTKRDMQEFIPQYM